jgi:hypothetical protein
MEFLTQAQKEIASIVFLNTDEKTELMREVMDTRFKNWKECLKFIHKRANELRCGDEDDLD